MRLTDLFDEFENPPLPVGRYLCRVCEVTRPRVGEPKAFHELIITMEQRGDIRICVTPRGGTAQRAYRLLVNAGGEGVKPEQGNEAIQVVKGEK